jgi:NADPH:quinone reductase-like Zn-dependent oxidoreductase
MRAYQLPQGTGIDALGKVDLPVPKPGPRQVLVKVAACSLNFRDLAIALGSYRMPTKPNIVPLSDGAGEVVEIGTGVSRVKVGDRVAGCFFQRWIGGPRPLTRIPSRWAAARSCAGSCPSLSHSPLYPCPLLESVRMVHGAPITALAWKG